MFQFFANIFGYLLQLLYMLINNYGLAIILFTLIIKLLLLPLSIKQQKTMKKSAKLQDKMKAIQFKYKNDQEKMNQEMMNLYKSENMSPFSGCLVGILQFVLLISIFYLVKSPLTYMEKVPQWLRDYFVRVFRHMDYDLSFSAYYDENFTNKIKKDVEETFKEYNLTNEQYEKIYRILMRETNKRIKEGVRNV